MSPWTEETVWTRGSRIHVLVTNGTGYRAGPGFASTSADWSATSTGTSVEHGDTRADATTVALGTRIGGMIDPGSDADCFKLVLNRSGILVFTGGDLDTATSQARWQSDHIQRRGSVLDACTKTPEGVLLPRGS